MNSPQSEHTRFPALESAQISPYQLICLHSGTPSTAKDIHGPQSKEHLLNSLTNILNNHCLRPRAEILITFLLICLFVFMFNIFYSNFICKFSFVQCINSKCGNGPRFEFSLFEAVFGTLILKKGRKWLLS